MQSPVTYETHKIIEAERFSERELSHRRALKGDLSSIGAETRASGILGRIVGRIRPPRPATAPGLLLSHDLSELAGAACLLGDGATGRIAVHRSQGAWIALCVAI